MFAVVRAVGGFDTTAVVDGTMVIQPGSYSPAGATELSALTTQNNALRRAWGFDVQGESDRFQGGLAKQGGILSGVGDLMTGTASAYDKYQENT